MNNCIELLEIILKDKGFYLRLKPIDFVMIDVYHVNIL